MSTVPLPHMAAPAPRAAPRNKSAEEKRRHREVLKRDFFNVPLVEDRYRVEKIIGQGAYGIVCQATDIYTGEKVAVKRVKRVLGSSASAIRALREVKFLRLLRHRNIISVKDILIPGERDQFNDIYIVFELMPADLGRLLRSRTSLEERHIKFLLFQLLCGVHFMHEARVFHRDLNPNNILVNHDCILRICDFGLARASFHAENDCHFWTNYVATRWYRAPELILSETTKYSTALDMWSIGCIFAEMLSRGHALFPGRNAQEQFELITRVVGRPNNEVINSLGPPRAREILRSLPTKPRVPLSVLFRHASPGAINLLERFLEFDADKRITAIDALRSPYFADFGPIDLGQTTGPLNEKEFAFEKGKLNVEQMRYEFLREIAHYHPNEAAQLLAPLRHDEFAQRGTGAGISVGGPSPAQKFGNAMSNVDQGIPVKDRSLPQAYFVSANPHDHVRASAPDFRSSTFGEKEMAHFEGSEALREQRMQNQGDAQGDQMMMS
eukprot:Plantae.Rhodophyta-Hildenbrandia_rubra.ctg40991.p1 GENE.Plantae.Rhodophyta-Hildenbrandia_rubra.ctg40991~~Plantae.Rhodophyta-Hildenbrandia_rubra.ctg40991.p1  ORF type:complete len:497 (-),score=76.83 Plantae.Rhodophyta-Hildenbrandia_rubra.ctg40991:518-2008(-)